MSVWCVTRLPTGRSGPPSKNLMARIAGLHRGERWAGWRKEPFTTDGSSQVVVYEKNSANGARSTHGHAGRSCACSPTDGSLDRLTVGDALRCAATV
jgi:hypothetical protein